MELDVAAVRTLPAVPAHRLGPAPRDVENREALFAGHTVSSQVPPAIAPEDLRDQGVPLSDDMRSRTGLGHATTSRYKEVFGVVAKKLWLS